VFRAYQRRSDEWPGCEYRDDRQANRAARAAGPGRGIRVTHGYAGHRCDGRIPGLRRPPTVPMAARRAYPASRIRMLASLGAFVALGKALF